MKFESTFRVGIMVLGVLVSGLWSLCASDLSTPATPRADVPPEFCWNPAHIYPDEAAFEADLAGFKRDLPAFGDYQGRLHESAETLYTFIEKTQAMGLRFRKMISYASLHYDTDQGDAHALDMMGRIQLLGPEFGKVVSFSQPEILQIDQATLDAFFNEHEGLRVYQYALEKLRRQKPYTLSQAEERIIALAGGLAQAPTNINNALINVDIQFPEIIDEQGEAVTMSMAGFTAYRASEVFAVRKQAAEAFFGALKKNQHISAATLNAEVQGHIFTKEARGYKSCLEAALYPDEISTDAYRMLINTIHERLSHTLHQYMTLRKKVLHLEGPVTFANLYNPMVEGVAPTYSYDECRDMLMTALAPMGKEYLGYLEEGMAPGSGWIDIYPNRNKESGAYSNGTLAGILHPFIKMNYNGSLDNVSTMAHEFGHAIHSIYSRRNQPEAYGDYTTFLAEVASTCNEELLLNHMLRNVKDDDVKLLLLNTRLENIRLTIMRQTLFAEFELAIHEHAEKGNPLTADYLNGLYRTLIEKYYGPDYVMQGDEDVEWSFISQF